MRVAAWRQNSFWYTTHNDGRTSRILTKKKTFNCSCLSRTQRVIQNTKEFFGHEMKREIKTDRWRGKNKDLHFTRWQRAWCWLAHGGMNVNQPVDHAVSCCQRGRRALHRSPIHNPSINAHILYSCLTKLHLPLNLFIRLSFQLLLLLSSVSLPFLFQFNNQPSPCPSCTLLFTYHWEISLHKSYISIDQTQKRLAFKNQSWKSW